MDLAHETFGQMMATLSHVTKDTMDLIEDAEFKDQI